MGACYSFLKPLIGPASRQPSPHNTGPSERTPLLADSQNNPHDGEDAEQSQSRAANGPHSTQKSELDRQKELTQIVTHMGSNLIDVTSVAQPEVLHQGKPSTDYIRLFDELEEKQPGYLDSLKSSLAASESQDTLLTLQDKEWLNSLAQEASTAMKADLQVSSPGPLFVTFD